MNCCFCNKEITPEISHNPLPARAWGRCCSDCNLDIVVPTRILFYKAKATEEDITNIVNMFDKQDVNTIKSILRVASK